MKTVTYFKCEVCDNEYQDADLARRCEADLAACEFSPKQMVFYEGGGNGGLFSRHGGKYAVAVRIVKRLPKLSRGLCCGYSLEQARSEGFASVGHRWDVELAAADENGTIHASPYWLDPAEGSYKDRSRGGSS